MADQFSIESKLVVTGVDVKGSLEIGPLKFKKIDTSALQKMVQDAGEAAKRIKTKFDNIKLNKLKVDVNQNSLRSIEVQIRKAIESAAKTARVEVQPSVTVKANMAASARSVDDGVRASKIAAKEHNNLQERLRKLDAETAKQASALQQSISKERENASKMALSAIDARSEREARALQKIVVEENKLAQVQKKRHTEAISQIEARTAKEAEALRKKVAKEGGVKGDLNFPSGSRVVDINSLGGGGGRIPPGVRNSAGGFDGSDGIRKTSDAMRDLADNTQTANKHQKTLAELTEEVGRKAAAFRGVAIAINTMVDVTQAGIKFVIDFNDSLIELNKILQLSDRSIQSVGDDLFGLSSKTGVAIDQTISIAQEFARAGLAGRGYGTVVELTDRALTGLQGTTLDAAQASELFIQIIQQVEANVRGLSKELVTTTKLFDVLGKAEDVTASKATDVQQAFKRSAASIFATGTTIEQATAIISVLQERTQRGGDVIGTALKTLASRISTSGSDATKALNDINVKTIDAQGNLRNLFDVLRDTSIAFQGLTEAERADIGVKVAGIRQVEVFRAALQDFSRTQDINNQLVAATGDAARKQAAEQTKLANVISKLQIAFQQLAKTASEGIIGEAFVFALTSVEKLITGISTFDKQMGGAVSTITAFAGVALGLRILIPMLQGIGRALGFFIGLQKQSAAAMTDIAAKGQIVGSTVNNKINSSIQKTAFITKEATSAMAIFATTTANAATQAERLSAASRMGGMGGAFQGPVAPGNQGPGGIGIVAAGVAGRGFKPVEQFKKEAGIATKAIQALGKHAFITGGLISVAGGIIQSQADSLRKSGRTGLAGAVDIGGGALGGAGTGALLGSVIAPGIGTAIGAAIGGVAGAVPGFVRTFMDAGDAIDDLRAKYLQLGIIQAENGEITSAVSEKLDKALRNLSSFKDFEINLDRNRFQNELDPEGAKDRIKKIEEAREGAGKDLLSGFDKNLSVTEQNTRVLQALSKVLQERTGDRGLDLSDPQLTKQGSPALAVIGENTLREIEAEALLLAEKFGLASGQIEQIFNEEIQKANARPFTKEAIAEQEKAVKERTDAFVESLDVLIPAGDQITKAAKEQSDKFKKAVEAIALGKGGEEARNAIKDFLSEVQSGRTIVKGANGENITGRAGRNELQSLIDVAEAILNQRQNIGVQGIGSALPEIMKRVLPFLSGGAKDTAIADAQGKLTASQDKVVEAFSNLRKEFPLENFSKLLTAPVNEFELILRDFISQFGREIQKLEEAQIQAITPQKELADALAKNALETAQSVDRRIRLEKSDAEERARKRFGELEGLGERQFAGVLGQEDNKKTVGDALGELFQALLDANRRIADERITDPDRQRSIISEARGNIDLSGINKKQIEAVVDNVSDLTKSFVRLDTEGLQAISKSNAAVVNSLKTRLSEEQRLIALDQRRRDALSLHARAMTEELTGIRKIVAEREIEAGLINSAISAQQGRLSGIDDEIIKLRGIEQTEKNRAGILDQLQILEQTRAEESIQLEEMLAKRRISAIRDTLSVANEANNVAKRTADSEQKRIGAMADIANMLSVNQTDIQKFNAELNSLGAQFRVSQAELAAEATTVRETIDDRAEREERLADIQRRGAALALDQAKAEAQVIQKRREAIKQASEELLGNQQQQVDAQRAIIDATKAVSDAFESYLQAVDGAIMATTRYNLGLALAEVETTKITGGFSGMREQIGVVQDAFRDAERLARELGASEKTLVDIRRESINQQLSLFNSLLQEQSQLARNFFTSSTQDQADLFLGIREAGSIADALGGSFAEFKKKGEVAINDLGAQLLALPQETRQRVISSLETLKTVGGEVGGFTADQLLTAIETASLGVSGEGLQVDPLFEVQERIATLQEEQARLATEQLIASQEQVVNAKQQLEQAQAAKDLAEIQLERIKEEGDKLRNKIGELRGQLNTTLLQQEQTQRQGFSAVTGAVMHAADAVITQLPDAFSVKLAEAFREVMREGGLTGTVTGRSIPESRPTPQTKGQQMADAMREAGSNRAAVQQSFAQAGPAPVNQIVASSSAVSGGGTNVDSTAQTVTKLDDILSELRTLNNTSESSLSVTEEIRDAAGNTIGTANAVAGANGSTEITINVEGNTTVTVTGFEAGVARLATVLGETLGGFVSADEARRIADEVLENIRTQLLRRGIITPTTT